MFHCIALLPFNYSFAKKQIKEKNAPKLGSSSTWIRMETGMSRGEFSGDLRNTRMLTYTIKSFQFTSRELTMLPTCEKTHQSLSW